MCGKEKRIERRHEKYREKIKDETFVVLEDLYNFIEEDIEIKNELPESIQVDLKDKKANLKYKCSLYYIRWCSIIEGLINESKDKEHIFYYLISNSLKEMNILGFTSYYDVKYEKKVENLLYSTGYGKCSNWINWLKKQNITKNEIKENGMQLIFKACNEHINRGGEVELKSLSKCLGVDLFKYMQLDKNNKANLYIIKDAKVNFIKIDDKECELQKYLLSDQSFDIDKNPQFCLDFSSPRNYKIENYNKWSRRFLSDSSYISEAEFSESKEQYCEDNSSKSYWLDSWILEYMRKSRAKDGEKAISSRISPIADKEVIASDTFWSIEKYGTNIEEYGTNIEEYEKNKCYHFVFEKSEYCQLIFLYFKKYTEEKLGKKVYESRYSNQISNELKSIKSIISEKENDNENQADNHDKMLNSNDLIEIYKRYQNFLEERKKFNNKDSKKIQIVLSLVEWEKEIIPNRWSLNNIYPVEENEENLFINLYKCICKRSVGE